MAALKQTVLAPASYPQRASVGDNVFDWEDPTYKPVDFTEAFILAYPKPVWADFLHVPFLDMLQRKTIDRKGDIVTLATAHKNYDFNKGLFLNPRGKTGIAGRGSLGLWGPNWAADVIVTKREDGKLWVILCEKQVGDGESVLCFPAGMVEAGEAVPETLRRELVEEAAEDGEAIDDLFRSCNMGCVYSGWVDDWRNTDHAWMVTQAHRFHATPEIAAKLTLAVKDTAEIKKSGWYVAEDVTKMYASHKDWLDKVIHDDAREQRAMAKAKAKPALDISDAKCKPPPPSPAVGEKHPRE